MGWILAAAATASAFNLVCVGTQTVKTAEPSVKTEETRETREYRIDLDARRWCVGQCTNSFPIASVEPYRLYLDKDKTTDPINSWIMINREDGQIIARNMFGSYVNSFIGMCVATPFTGLPNRQF